MSPIPLNDIKPEHMYRANHLILEYVQQAGCTPSVEKFVVTSVGGMCYAVSIEHGHAYTRPQLVQKYGRFPATFTFTEGK